MKVAIVLPGLHRVQRGAETALECIGRGLAARHGWAVTLFGSGQAREGEPYRFVHVPCTPRERFERWPRFPALRSETAWEELSFVTNLRKVYDADFDATIACSFPFCHWYLRARTRRGVRPRHLFVTQNGDWPCRRQNAEYRFFACDGLVCINPEYFEQHRPRYRAWLIPNGVETREFTPGKGDRVAFGLSDHGPVILMVSALIESKRVEDGIRVAARIPDAQLIVAGDGPLRDRVMAAGQQLMPGRFHRVTAPRSAMPGLYRCADVVLHLSLDEPFGNVYTEALATGRAIVTHDRPTTRWALEGAATLLDTTDLDQVTLAVGRAIASGDQPSVDARVLLARRRFDWSIISDAYASALSDMVNQPAGHAPAGAGNSR